MGIYLTQPIKHKNTATGKSMKISFASSSMQGWRNSMEDAHIANLQFDQDTELFAIFDGHGGKDVAEYCQQNFGRFLLENQNYTSNKIKEALAETFEKIDEELEKEGKDMFYQAGCTANVILIRNKQLYIANAGDSRAILSEKSGKVTALSIDHKPEMDTEKDRILKAGGFISNGRINGNLNLSRALGDLEYKRDFNKSRGEQLISCLPDIVKKIINEQINNVQIEKTIDETFDFILMGCDGVYEMLSNDSLAEYIRNQFRSTEGDLESTVENLLEQIIAPNTQCLIQLFLIKVICFVEGIGCDNMSAIIIKFLFNQQQQE